MTFLQAKVFGLNIMARWNGMESAWQVTFRLSTGDSAVRMFRKRYRADEFASKVMGAVVKEVPMHPGASS